MALPFKFCFTGTVLFFSVTKDLDSGDLLSGLQSVKLRKTDKSEYQPKTKYLLFNINKSRFLKYRFNICINKFCMHNTSTIKYVLYIVIQGLEFEQAVQACIYT